MTVEGVVKELVLAARRAPSMFPGLSLRPYVHDTRFVRHDYDVDRRVMPGQEPSGQEIVAKGGVRIRYISTAPEISSVEPSI